MRESQALTIRKEWVGKWLRRVIADREVFAAAPAHGGESVFRRIASPDEVQWTGDNPLNPPKSVLMPQTDPVVEITANGGGTMVAAIDDARPRVLFAVRSCDARGIAFITRMQAMDPPDAAYLRRAAGVTVVTLACSQPCALGFCICCDAGPFLEEDFDLQLTDLGDRFLAEVGSDKGEQLVALAPECFHPPEAEQIVERQRLEELAKGAFGAETCHFASAMRRVSTGRVAAELWEEVAARCLECGACNFVCPTCYCFSVKDQRRDGRWVRCRTWDSCQFAAFTLEASGHNPREQQRERVKRRFFHKLSAQYFRRDGAVGCVGCGRCIKVCFGATDMPAVVAAVRKGAWHG